MVKPVQHLSIIISFLALLSTATAARNDTLSNFKPETTQLEGEIDPIIKEDAKEFPEIELIVVFRRKPEPSKFVALYQRDPKQSPEETANIYLDCMPLYEKITEQVGQMKCRHGNRVAGATKISGKNGTYIVFASFKRGGNIEFIVNNLRAKLCEKYQLDNCKMN